MSTTKPDKKPRPVPAAIAELRELDQWVGYSHSKIPISPHGTPASSTDPKTWGTLVEAKFVRNAQGLPGVGFVFSEDDPYVGIDLDKCIDANTGELADWAREIVEELDSYTELSPGGLGLHIWTKGDIPRSGAKRTDKDTGLRVEVYKEHRYFTVTGKRWEWSPRDTIEERAEELTAFWERIDFDRAAEGGGDGGYYEAIDWEAPDVEAWLADALNFIDADCDYDEWIKVGMAIKSELGDRGFAYWDAWSRASGKYPGEAKCERKWRKLPHAPRDVTIATIVWMAEREGFEVPRGVARIPSGFEDGWDQWLGAHGGVDEPATQSSGLTLDWEDYVDLYLDHSPPEPYLIEPRVAGAGDIILLFGPPKSAKSLLCLDLFRQMALGKSWLGLLHPTRPLRIAYMQFEVKRDALRERVQLANLTHRELDQMRGNFKMTNRFTPKLTAAFVEECTRSTLEAFGGSIDILILDPLANIYSGQNENDNAEMSDFIRKIKVMRNMISPQCALVLVHHASKMSKDARKADPFQAARGASSLRGAYDAGIFLDVEGDEEKDELLTRRIWFELRNGPKIRSQAIVLDIAAGKWRLKDSDDRKKEGDLSFEGPDFEHMQIVDILREEAGEGRIYTTRTFRETFAGTRGMGGSSTIAKRLSTMATRQELRYFTGVRDELAGIEEVDARSAGYICVPDMQFGIPIEDEKGKFIRLVGIDPTKKKDQASGKVIECDGWRDVI